MKCIYQPFKELEGIRGIKQNIKSNNTPIYVSGCIDSQKCHFIYGISKDIVDVKVIVTYNEMRAKEIFEDMKFYDENVYLYPSKDVIFYSADIHSNYILANRFDVVKSIIKDDNMTVILTIDAALDKLIPLEMIKENICTINISDNIKLSKLIEHLIHIGYERVDQVEGAGQFSLRGGILDIYSLIEESAYRIEFWDEEVDSIRTIDLNSQRSVDKVEKITIFPNSEIILTKQQIFNGFKEIEKERDKIISTFRNEGKVEEINRISDIIEELKDRVVNQNRLNGLEAYLKYFYNDTVCLFDYFDRENTLIILDEPVRLRERYEVITEEFRQSITSRLEHGYLLPSQMNILFEYDDIIHKLQNKKITILSTLTQNIKEMNVAESYNLIVKSINSYNNSYELLVKDLLHWQNLKYKVVLLAGSRTRAERLTKELLDNGIRAKYSDDLDTDARQGEIIVGFGNIHKGFEYPLINFIILSESDVFGKSKKKKSKKKYYQGKKIQSFTDLTVGDYVVHENHGLGIFKGIEKVDIEGISKDYIKIEYSDEGILFVSTSQLDIIQKYIGGEGRKPKLNKLGSSEWKKTKIRVKKAVEDIAKDLVELYALRQSKHGYVYSKDNVWQKEFEEMFPYEETDDQLNAIEDTKKDMESDRIMDRLICGDVGYGKTEVAIRAAFKAIQDGKQVAYLVPTTILAQQHYNNFIQRMKDFPINLGLLSRFRTPKEIKLTLEGLKKGLVDIVIGTHRLLSKDVAFKDLGLLIIDEEQRFGVKHKEKIKQIKENVDVLTLTATPIPRTLHMSLIGIRDMSVLEEPPEERLPIQTYVIELNDEMIKEAIHRELARDGQIYYVYNRVNNIDEIADRIAKMIPEANVAYAHGQMKERELEKIMFDFINGDIDVLVSTTIIETGLDISNVNTIIIHDADHMGLSQLYQLRGRVGRSNRVAYAYLCYKRNKILKETAEKRLHAIREFTELGSGFKIAMRDLEIRGAGNLLGAQQHGHMEAVGYDMYCKLLEEAINAITNTNYEYKFDTNIDLNISAYIPTNYVRNEVQKLNIYKRIASIENEDDYLEMQEELIDRYGDLPASVINLLEVALIKAIAHSAYIVSIEQNRNVILFKMHNEAPVDVSKINTLTQEFKNKLFFEIKDTPHFKCKLEKNEIKGIFSNIKIMLQAIKNLMY